MYEFKVGQKYHLDVSKQDEGVIFDFSNEGATLLMLYNSPYETEINNIRKGEVKLGMYQKNNILFMLYKFGSEAWIDAPYNVNLSGNYQLQEIMPGMGYSNHIILVNIRDGVIKAMRLIGWTEKFSQYFKEYVNQQRIMPFDKKSYDEKLNKIYRNYTTKDLVNRTDITMKVGE